MAPPKQTGWASTSFTPLADPDAKWKCTAVVKKKPCGNQSPLTESECTKCQHVRCEKCTILHEDLKK